MTDECEKIVAWQPIETAPRDGTAFLAWKPGAAPYVARRDCDIVHYSGWGGGVWEGQGGYAKHNLDALSHWMPLPEPPDEFIIIPRLK